MTSPGETLVNSVPNADIVAQEASGESVIQRSLQYIGRVASRTALSLSLAISGGALTGTASEIGTPSPAAATGETGGYPDWNKPCVAQGPNFGRTEGSGYWCNLYQWGDSPSQQNSPRFYGYRNCTDWVAWRVQNAGVGSVPGTWYDAKSWDNYAPADKVDNTPEPGDIAVWDGGTLGHVAFVESVNPNGTVNISEYNRGLDGNYGTRTNQIADHYIDLNGRGKGINGEPWPGPGSGNPAPPPDTIDELGFVRMNHYSGQTGLVSYHGAPSYHALYNNALTAYPAISDPHNVKPLAIDVNGDGIDELGFVRMNHYSGQTGIAIYHGAPTYHALHTNALTGYPAIGDPENVTPLAIDVTGDGIDELAFVRMNHHLGRTGIDVYTGAPHYNILLASGLTGYPAISDPWNVRPIAIDVNGDRTDELAFVRMNHYAGKTAIDVYYGTPNYYALYTSGLTGYPSISDPENVVPIAIDLNQDKTDELAFVRLNHYSGQSGLVAYNGAPTYFNLYANYVLPYPSVSDPQNVTPLAISLNNN